MIVEVVYLQMFYNFPSLAHTFIGIVTFTTHQHVHVISLRIQSFEHIHTERQCGSLHKRNK